VGGARKNAGRERITKPVSGNFRGKNQDQGKEDRSKSVTPAIYSHRENRVTGDQSEESEKGGEGENRKKLQKEYKETWSPLRRRRDFGHWKKRVHPLTDPRGEWTSQEA